MSTRDNERESARADVLACPERFNQTSAEGTHVQVSCHSIASPPPDLRPPVSRMLCKSMRWSSPECQRWIPVVGGLSFLP
eukprot:1738085-Amphidinium_carterae.2